MLFSLFGKTPSPVTLPERRAESLSLVVLSLPRMGCGKKSPREEGSFLEEGKYHDHTDDRKKRMEKAISLIFLLLYGCFPPMDALGRGTLHG
jgi:hypothetical protein